MVFLEVPQSEFRCSGTGNILVWDQAMGVFVWHVIKVLESASESDLIKIDVIFVLQKVINLRQ